MVFSAVAKRPNGYATRPFSKYIGYAYTTSTLSKNVFFIPKYGLSSK